MVNLKGLRLVTRPGHPDFLDLPWDLPLEQWNHERLVEVARGTHRHVVRFVHYDQALYVLKEMPLRLVRREYRMLRHMAEEGLPVVEVVGAVDREGHESVLITRHLDYSLPYRTLFAQRRARGLGDEVGPLTSRLLDALASLLARLHLAGFYWGDCSLSNTLFRRDAGELAAYLVDAETSEHHATLTSGQRQTDLTLTAENVAGGLFDVAAELGAETALDPVSVADEVVVRYTRLWDELTARVAIPAGQDAREVVNRRLRRLNALGFDVAELEYSPTPDGDQLQLRPVVVEAGHHRHRLHSLTGIEAQENQARSLLNDLANWRAWHERAEGRVIPETVAAHRWTTEVVEPVLQAVPDALRGRREPVELFHEIIQHKWFMSEEAGSDVGVEVAARAYMDAVLAATSEERIVADEGEQ